MAIHISFCFPMDNTKIVIFVKLILRGFPRRRRGKPPINKDNYIIFKYLYTTIFPSESAFFKIPIIPSIKPNIAGIPVKENTAYKTPASIFFE